MIGRKRERAMERNLKMDGKGWRRVVMVERHDGGGAILGEMDINWNCINAIWPCELFVLLSFQLCKAEVIDLPSLRDAGRT